MFIFLIRSNIVKEHCERYIDGILANLNSAHSSRSVSYSLYRHKASTVCNCFVLINLFEQVGVFSKYMCILLLFTYVVTIKEYYETTVTYYVYFLNTCSLDIPLSAQYFTNVKVDQT